MGLSLLRVPGFILLNGLLCWGAAPDPLLTIEPNWSTLFTGESVTFICDMRQGDDVDWYYLLMDGRQTHSQWKNKIFKLDPLDIGDSGEYKCYGTSKKSYVKRFSNKVSLTVTGANVILQHPASVLYVGERVPLRCRQRNHDPKQARTASFYENGALIGSMTSQNATGITHLPLPDGASYTCKFDTGEESKAIRLKLEPDSPKAQLSKDKINIPAGGNVTLTCSVSGPSSGWSYFWYRGRKTRQPMTPQDAAFLSSAEISVSQGGVYWCRGGRGGTHPLYYTAHSDPVVTSRAEVTLRTSWPEIYRGETVTLTCDIVDGEDTEWEYDWVLPGSSASKRTEYMIRYASNTLIEDYRCRGRAKGGGPSTEWSEALRVTRSDDKPVPVLVVSSSWPGSGGSVTLTCEMEDPSAGWRFYWFKALPDLQSYLYRLEPLSTGGVDGTRRDSCVVRGQERTSAYQCRAGRGNPVFYTHYSALKFAWSGDMNSEASLRVSPDRSQHLIDESVSLSCHGNSTRWRVNRLSKSGYWSRCSQSNWGAMNGSVCNISSIYLDGVYWCETGTGLFSNAVNITGKSNDIIVTSPVHSVAEGASVTLGCKLRTEEAPSDVRFYKNGELVRSDAGAELTIVAASKSDEGFYKCEARGSQSPPRSWTSQESWMSVKATPASQGSGVPVTLIVVPVAGALLILLLLLLLLYHYRKSKESCFIRSVQPSGSIRSRSANQGSAADHMTNQDETQREDKPGDVTYSSVMLNNINKKENKEPEESNVYSNVKIRSAAEKSNPAAVNDTIYSEVKAGASLDQ